jgi:hypothetical protein
MLALNRFEEGVMTMGDMVKFKEPVDVHEADERFVVLEDRGDRVLVGALFTGLIFGTATVLRTDDLTPALPYEEGRSAGLEDSANTGLFLTLSPYPDGTKERLDWNRGYHEMSGQCWPTLPHRKG